MVMFKKVSYICIGFILHISTIFADVTKDSILEGMVPKGTKIIADIDSGNGLGSLDVIFAWIKDSIFWLLMLLAIWVFLFLWIRLVIARWNPEEFKKAMQSLLYAVVWLFVVSASWAAVKLVSWLNIS